MCRCDECTGGLDDGRYCEGEVDANDVYPLDELEAMDVLEQGQADDLLIHSEDYKLWLSRCGVEDGEPCDNKVTIEVRRDGRWTEIGWYEAV